MHLFKSCRVFGVNNLQSILRRENTAKLETVQVLGDCVCVCVHVHTCTWGVVYICVHPCLCSHKSGQLTHCREKSQNSWRLAEDDQVNIGLKIPKIHQDGRGKTGKPRDYV